MEDPTLCSINHFDGPERYGDHEVSPDSAVLMDTIFQYLREDPPESSPPTPVDAKIQTWAASLPDFQACPADTEIHTYPEHDGSSVHSSASPVESLFSDSSSLNDSSGAETPPLASSTNDTALRLTREDKLMFPEMPMLPAPMPQVNLNRNCSLRRRSEVVRSPSRAASSSRRVSFGLPSNSSSPAVERAPISNTPWRDQRMQANITELVPLPEFIPSPLKAPTGRKPMVPPPLQVSAPDPGAPQWPSVVHPEWELSFPLTLPTYAERKAQKYRDEVRQSAPVHDHTLDLLKRFDEMKVSPSRQSIATSSRPSPPRRRESSNRFDIGRQSMQIQIPSPEQAPPIQDIPVGAPTQRLAGTEPEFLRSLEVNIAPTRRHSSQPPGPRLTIRGPSEFPVQTPARKPVGADEANRRMQRKKEIERVPDQPAEVVAAPLLPMSSGVWFTKGFLTGREGMLIRMTRLIRNFSKMEWLIERDDGSRMLQSFGHSHSLSRRTDFAHVDDTPLFTLQKKTGSTRVAEAPKGLALFTIRNSLHAMPLWTITLGSDHATAGSTQWTAQGDALLETVVVHWGGFQVGRISLAAPAKKHSYILDIAPEVNYCVIAALATVFDDLRTDEGC